MGYMRGSTLFSIFELFKFQFFNSVRKETIDCDSNALPEGVYVKESQSQEVSCCSVERGTCESWQTASERTRMSTFSSTQASEKDWRKKFELKDFARSPSKKHSRTQCWEDRKGTRTTPPCSEFGHKCAVRHQQTEEQSSQKPKQKVTKIVAKSGRVLQDYEPPKCSRSLRKSTSLETD